MNTHKKTTTENSLNAKKNNTEKPEKEWKQLLQEEVGKL